MRWQVEWSRTFERSLGRISWQEAERVCAAVLRYAETGEGAVQRLELDDAVTVRLRVGSYFVRLTLDRLSGVMHVWALYRLR